MPSKRCAMRVRGILRSVKVAMISILARLPGLMFQLFGRHFRVWFISSTRFVSLIILLAMAMVRGIVFLRAGFWFIVRRPNCYASFLVWAWFAWILVYRF